MYKEVLQSIKGVDMYAIISLMIFFLAFLIIVIRLFRIDKNQLNKMAQIPLEPENDSQNFKGE